MSINRLATLTEQVRANNYRLETHLNNRVGISLELYKVIKNLTQLAGAGAGIYAMSLGADPLMTFALIAGIITGPEALEYVLTHQPRE